jgi:sugar fermentation stimulation protein A
MTPPVPTDALPWPPLLRGTLIRRYKRFLADVRLADGSVVTAHCPNSGSMTGCCEPGRPVYLSPHDSPRRKLKYTWELIDMGTSLVGVNTQVPNRLVAGSVRAGRVAELCGYREVKREVAVGDGSRLDMALYGGDRTCFVEVKNCTLVSDGLARFPDAVTSRGLKHLVTLQRLAAEGSRSVIFFLIQRMDARRFVPADDIDPAYGRELRRATAAGVEMLAYDVRIDEAAVSLNRRIETRLPALP